MVKDRNAFINGEGRRLIVIEEPEKSRRSVHNPYTEAEKKTALLLSREIGVQKAAKSLGMNPQSIYRWAKETNTDVYVRKPGSPKNIAEKTEARKIKNENEFLKSENARLRGLITRIIG